LPQYIKLLTVTNIVNAYQVG